MKQLTKLVSVRKITSSVSKGEFNHANIELMANLLIECETTINPLVLRQTGLNNYQVISGHMVYHAAARAREINLLKAETIQAIVVTPENEAAVMQQIDILRG